MLTPADFIRLPFTSDLNQAGVLYTLQALAGGLLQAENLDLDPLHNMITDVAAALAFRRCLAENHVSFRTLEVAPFSQPGLEQVILSGHGCHLINRNLNPRAWTNDVARLCAAPASLSKAHLQSERLGSADLLVFTYTLPQPGASRRERDRSTPLILIFPTAWRNPRKPGSNTSRSLSFESSQEMTLEIGGLGTSGQIQTEDLQLVAHQRTLARMDYSTLAYLATKNTPTRMINVLWDKFAIKLQILPESWEKPGLDWKEIILLGYTTVGNFRNHARSTRLVHHPFLRFPLPSQAIYLPVGDLQPMSQLFAWVLEQ